ncbi:MAG: hypothetical protein A3H27_13485 [Acidobacteria bacterium RIFCSPLOWO2_02_FULL_59_13]|nr:MAG: hypothetical protein A3H27_13485 [Acidobacteria bacterium RIFCSPLOWO2_02_FULL_59_13]
MASIFGERSRPAPFILSSWMEPSVANDAFKETNMRKLTHSDQFLIEHNLFIICNANWLPDWMPRC